jgi:hypothetical protein
VSSGAVFRDDPASHTLWSTIEQPSLRDRIKEILQGMHEEAQLQQDQGRDNMTYDEMLESGVLYEGERIIEDVPPMLLRSVVSQNRQTPVQQCSACSTADAVQQPRDPVRPGREGPARRPGEHGGEPLRDPLLLSGPSGSFTRA